VVLLGGLQGCGPAASTSEPRAAFLKQAEAVCAQANADQKALTTPTGVADLPGYVAQVVAIADRAATQLAALPIPAADRSELQKRVIGPLREQLAIGHRYADQVAAAARAHDQVALLKLLGSPPSDTKADLRWMKHYGFDACVKAADTSG
jgi:hypothetical protein